MKIMLYTSILGGGGAERVLCELATELSSKNDVYLVASYKTEKEYSVSKNIQKIY